MAITKTVYVGLSGGVDSALAASHLLREGYLVVGVFIKIWQPEFVECTWREDRIAAKRAAVHLGIPFKEIDLSEAYKEEVIARMKSAYSEGRTPNPDVLCNRFIKFGMFKEWALKDGADYVATGHHAQVVERDGAFSLVRGVDPGKDQVYFLCQLSQSDLEKALFPIGHMQKVEVRKEAERLNLPSAYRPDSQGLCFVGDIDMHDFLKVLLDTKPGDVLAENREVIGAHDGAALYTLGQRHGFHIAHADFAGEILYVSALDIAKNTIIVSKSSDSARRKTIPVKNFSSTTGEEVAEGTYTAEVRYHQIPQECSVSYKNGEMLVQFEKSQLAMPGQFLVLYSGNECLGGGEIA